jgi:hypothetical protein
MNGEPIDIVHQWLSLLGVRIPKSWILQRLGTHPEYPSVLSVTDLLDELGLENAACVLEPDQLDKMTQPFLAYVDDNKAVVVKRGNDLLKFGARWNGVVVLAEKPASWTLPTALANDANRQGQQTFSTAIAGSLSAVLCIFAMLALPAIQAIELVVCMLGLLLSVSFVQQMWGNPTLLAKKLCGSTETENACQKLRDESPRLPYGLTMADFSIAYFAGLIAVYVSACLLSINSRPLTSALIALGVPATLYSVYLQRRKLKKWCGLCQWINATLWILAALQFAQAPVEARVSSGLYILLLAFIVPGVSWMGIRSLIDEAYASRGKLIKLGRLHRDSELFLSYLFSQQPIDTQQLPSDFTIGSRQASLQIVAVLSYACDNCEESYATLAALVKSDPENIGVTFRFKVNPQPSAGGKHSVLRQMMAYAVENGIFNDDAKITRMIGDWFSHKDVERYLEQHPVSNHCDVQSHIEAQASWCRDAEIVSTPALFVNGHRLRLPYSTEDLVEHYAAIVEATAGTDEQPESQLCPIGVLAGEVSANEV